MAGNGVTGSETEPIGNGRHIAVGGSGGDSSWVFEICVSFKVGMCWTHQRDHKFRTFLTMSVCELCCWRYLLPLFLFLLWLLLQQLLWFTELFICLSLHLRFVWSSTRVSFQFSLSLTFQPIPTPHQLSAAFAIHHSWQTKSSSWSYEHSDYSQLWRLKCRKGITH